MNEEYFYINTGVECGSAYNMGLSVFSAMTLAIYMAFLYIEINLYNSCHLETKLPWASLERKLPLINVVFKLVISFTFVFDKRGTILPYARLLLSFIGGVVAFKRLGFSVLLDPYIFYASSFYDNFNCWMFLMVAIHQLSNLSITIAKLTLILTSGVFVAATVVIVGEKLRKIAL